MGQKLDSLEQPVPPLSVNPKRFLLWLFMVSIFILFSAFISAYIVKQADKGALDIELPPIFWISTFIILLSSVTMHWAYYAAKKDHTRAIKTGLIFTIVLGICFLGSQFLGWQELVDMDVYFVGNASGSFLYVFSGVHGFHIISGIIFLFIVLAAAVRYKVHAKKLLQIEICTTYWHFLGGLWIYLFIFLKFFS